MSEIKGPRIKTMHMAIGVDLLGSKTSFVSGRNYEIEATPVGAKIHSTATGRTIVVPYGNVKAFELDNGVSSTGSSSSASARRDQALKDAGKAPVQATTATPEVKAPLLSEEEQREQAAEARAAARRLAKEQSLAQIAAEKVKKG